MTSAFIAKILNDPTPTTDAKSERFLAVALGYPPTWRVCRRIIIEDKEETDTNLIENNGTPIKSTVKRKKIQDVIYAGNPKKNVDRWYCHEAAQIASVEFNGDAYQFDGGHMTKEVPKFEKGDKVEVRYSRKWYAAEIVRRKMKQTKAKTTKKQKDSDDNKKKNYDGITYTVRYTEDDSIQENVRERNIRMAPPDSSALELAGKLGLPEGWRATKNNKRYIFVSPDGIIFRNKKTAMAYVRKNIPDENEDPPWRAAGHPLIGREVLYSHVHKLSGARSVTIEQRGVVKGWISDTDTDRHGKPGYVSEKTNQPTALFHIIFDEVSPHRYPKFLLAYQDMEESEINDILLPEDTSQGKKKRARHS